MLEPCHALVGRGGSGVYYALGAIAPVRLYRTLEKAHGQPGRIRGPGLKLGQQAAVDASGWLLSQLLDVTRLPAFITGTSGQTVVVSMAEDGNVRRLNRCRLSRVVAYARAIGKDRMIEAELATLNRSGRRRLSPLG